VLVLALLHWPPFMAGLNHPTHLDSMVIKGNGRRLTPEVVGLVSITPSKLIGQKYTVKLVSRACRNATPKAPRDVRFENSLSDIMGSGIRVVDFSQRKAPIPTRPCIKETSIL
jgi:hypothetical protein